MKKSKSGASRVVGLASIVFCMSCMDLDAESEIESEVVVARPDLVELDVSGPASDLTAPVLTSFSVTDTVGNNGTAAMPASTTTFYLSPDGVTKAAVKDVKIGTRSVPPIGIGGQHSGPATLATKTGAPDGDYYVLACADTPNVMKELNELNNCSSDPDFVLHLASPDLVVASLDEPPASLLVKQTFTVTDRDANQGNGPSLTSSTTKYFLSTDGIAHTKQIGLRTVLALAANDPGTDVVTSVTVPAGTPTGSYYLLACSDTPSVIFEGIETNNCRHSSGTVSVTGPDLIETGVSLSVTTMGVNDTIDITDTLENIDVSAAGFSSTKFFISLDAVRTTADLYMLPTCTYPWSRSVTSLAAGGSSTATTTAQLCYRTTGSSVVQHLGPGTYHIIACADTNSDVGETNEVNNCTDATTTVTVTP